MKPSHLGKLDLETHQCDVIGIRDMSMDFSDGSHLTIKDARHVPQLTRSLMSVGQLDDNGYKVIFLPNPFV